MMSRVFKVMVVIAAVAGGLPILAQTAEVSGTWTAEFHDGKAFLQVRSSTPRDANGDRPWNGGDWSMGQSFPVDELSGLPGNDQNLTAANVRFEMRREAGTLSFEGSFRDGRGAGLFTFAPRNEYTSEMRRLGYNDDLPLWRRYQLAVHDVGPRYINALKAEGFPGTGAPGQDNARLTLDEVQRAKTHGVTIEYIKEIKAQGFRAVSLENLVRTRDHGVTAEFIKAMKAEGFNGASLEDFVRLRDHGVNQKYLQDMKRAFGSGTTLEDLVRARDHGVTPEYVAEIKALGFSAQTGRGQGPPGQNWNSSCACATTA